MSFNLEKDDCQNKNINDNLLPKDCQCNDKGDGKMIVFAYILAAIVLLFVVTAVSYIVTASFLKFAFWVCKKLGVEED